MHARCLPHLPATPPCHTSLRNGELSLPHPLGTHLGYYDLSRRIEGMEELACEVHIVILGACSAVD